MFGRTPGFRALKKMLLQAQIQENQASNEQGEINRRTFLQIGGLVAAAGLGGGYLAIRSSKSLRLPSSESGPRVVILGAGIAGLNAAYHLKRNGVTAEIFEGSNRIGGRMWTARGADSVADGITVERGGEFIDSNHQEMLWLTKQFNLHADLIDVQIASENALEGDAFFINGARLDSKQVVKGLRKAVNQMILDRRRAKENKKYFEKIDHTPLSVYINQLQVDESIRQILRVAYVTEYGLEVEDQTPWNMINLISFQPYKDFEMFGPSDERFKIRGGNDRLITALSSKLQNQIETDHKFIALEKTTSGRYTVHFENRAPISADYVIMTIPFNLLRNCDLSLAEFPQWKTDVIQQLGYGNNAKFICGFNRAAWREQGFQGYVFTDSGYQSGWDSSQLQTSNGQPASYTFYSGGNLAKGLGSQSASALEAQFLGELNQIFPGARELFNQRSMIVPWPDLDFFKMSYAAYRVGQYSTIAGKEILPVDRIYFAGEHCSLAFQGYMNGGAITGKKAARDLLKAMNKEATTETEMREEVVEARGSI